MNNNDFNDDHGFVAHTNDFVGSGDATSGDDALFADAYRNGFSRLATQAPPAPPLPAPERSRIPMTGRRWAAGLAAAAVLTLVAAVGIQSFTDGPASPAAPPTASGSGASPTVQPTSSAPPTSNTSPLTPAELALAKTIAGDGSGKVDPKAWVVKSTYREFWSIVTVPDLVVGDEAKSDEPILVVLVEGKISPTGTPFPSPYPTGKETAFLVVKASAATANQSFGNDVYPNVGGMAVLQKFSGEIVPIDLTK